MQVLFSTLLLASLAAASPLVSRNQAGSIDLSAQVVERIQIIAEDATKLNSTLNTFRPDEFLGIFTALKIQDQTSQLNTDLTNAARVASASACWNTSGSEAVAGAIVNTLEPVIFAVLTNIVSRKPAFATAVFFFGDLSETVESDLQTQSGLSAQFGNAVTSKLTPAFAGFAPIINGAIAQAFTNATEAYQSCTGDICLPNLSGLASILGL